MGRNQHILQQKWKFGKGEGAWGTDDWLKRMQSFCSEDESIIWVLPAGMQWRDIEKKCTKELFLLLALFRAELKLAAARCSVSF